MDAASHLVRRSRLRSFAAGAGHWLNLDSRSPNDSSLEERYNPDLTYNTVISNEAVTTSTAKTTTTKAAATTATTSSKAATSTAAVSTTRAAAKAATAGTTRTSVTTAITTSKAADYVTKSTVVSSAAQSTVSSSSAVTSSTAASTSSSKSTSSSTPTSTFHSTSASSIAKSTSSTSHTVLTVTSNNAAASTSSSAKASATAAASSGTTTHGMSTGSVVGAVFGVVVGLVLLGALGGWLYRKYTARSYSTKSPWSKLNDDITPFPSSFEKDGRSGGDIYGSTTSAPVIGSRRALALARNNAFNNDGSLRPDSEIYQRDNRAGLGAGGMAFSPYPSLQQPVGVYGMDPHGRPYNPHAGRTPMDHTLDAQYDDDPYQYSVSNTRQLVGATPMPVAMPMGRPAAPQTDAELAQAEDFADIPEPYTPGLAYADGALITPVYENANPVWPNEKEQSRPSMTTPTMGSGPLVNVEPVVTPPSVMRMPLPSLAPLSPLSSSFNLNRQSQPLAMYEDEPSQQKRMYGEVAQTAGIDEPTTPNTAIGHLNESTTSTSSSFSAAPIHNSLPTLTALPRLPELSLAPPQPYQHGQPLSPLNEVPTPLSTSSVSPNPFDQINMPVPPYRQDALAPPYSSSMGSSFPSPAYPPPSPGGMSVPGSVTDSPRRWSGAPRNTASGRVVSAYDEEDAYGGI